MKATKQGDKRPRALVRRMREALRTLRAAYRAALQHTERSGTEEWLCDNFYLLEREGRAVMQTCKTLPPLPTAPDGLPGAFSLCRELTRDGTLAAQDKLEKELRMKRLNSLELELLALLLRAALVCHAAEHCQINTPENAAVLGASIKTLRNLDDIDFDALFEHVSEVERILSEDPAGVYPQMDEATRAEYRRMTAEQARAQGISEAQAARGTVEAAQAGETERERHVGAHLRPVKDRSRRGRVFLWLEALLPAVGCVTLAVLLRAWYLIPLLYFPLWELLRFPLEALSLRGVPPKTLPRIELRATIPEQARTLIAVSTLLPPAAKTKPLQTHLEQLGRANRQGAVSVCVLADLKGADSLTLPEDAADLAAAQRMIDRLNRENGGGFLLAVRARTYSPTQGNYTGWERKRGAITQLIAAISGEHAPTMTLYGDLSGFHDVRYLLALDGDTNLPLDTVADLVSAAIHPLNTPVVDEAAGRVTAGYGILAPRVEVEIASAAATGFSRAMAGAGGITAYENATSDRYQDLFGEGIFAGKGLIDVRAFHMLLGRAFEPERVLSHDILEGGFLRVGFLSDVQVTDGFPRREGAYLDRQHRWVRGDWQNLSWLFGSRRNGVDRRANPLTSLSRYKLFDNLRRSITPVVSTLALLLAVFMPVPAAAVMLAVCLLAAAGGELFAALRTVFSGGLSLFSRKTYSRAMPASLASLARAGIQLMMLPQTGFVCADAILRALWRQFVSRKKLLEWVTAADADRAQKPSALFKRYLPGCVVGVVLLFSGKWFLFAAGVLFLLNLPYAFVSGKAAPPEAPEIGWVARDRLTSYAAAMWRYYEEFCGVADNYLPPDNVQETPVQRVAHRTSPTNIGMMLLSTLAARDFGFIDSAMLCTRLENALDSVEKLETWHGSLLNWYDTHTLHAMAPRYVSTVDSGNFICCITALRQGLSEYAGECPALHAVAERLTALIDACDLRPLYNKRRRLFHIGYDLEQEQLTPSYYDLLMSEARMTSYYAVASRMVPKRHWGALGRTLARAGRYVGPVSWTGTMFEYFMPHILLPACKNSLLDEALRFCAWCQRRRVHGKDIPWGISESGFYAFDAQLNYQYKAHGVQKLGLKRGMHSDLVISPYSTFLVLPFEPEAAVRNLRELEAMQMTGRCGFYEAADFTKERLEGQDYAVVRSYMAHHVGMSLLSVCNALKDQVMQRRFMRDGRMAAAGSLLEEQIPCDAVVFEDVILRETPQRPERTTPQTREIIGINPTAPNVSLLTNSEWTTVVTDCGASVSLYRGADITRRSDDLLRRPQGIFAVLATQDMTLPLMDVLDPADPAQYHAQFSHTEITLTAKRNAVEAAMITSVHPRLPCECRTVSVKNERRTQLDGELLLYFEPSLTPPVEEMSHPAFSRLFLEPAFDEDNRVLLFTKRPRGNRQPLCLAVGFTGSVPFAFETAREVVLDRPNGVFSLLHPPAAFQGGNGAPDVCAAFRIPVKVAPHGKQEVSLLLCAASTREEAVERLLRARLEGGVARRKGAPCPFSSGGLDGVIASTALPQLLYHPRETREYLAAAQENKRGQSALWQLGISGDHPILYLAVHNAEDVSRAQPYVRLHRKLRRCGIMTDLAIVYREGGAYAPPILDALRSLLLAEDCLDTLNVNGGIHAVDTGIQPGELIVTLQAAAHYIAPRTAERLEPPALPYTPLSPQPVRPDPKLPETPLLEVEKGIFSDGAFTVTRKPDAPWCHVLANSVFGTLVGDGALGYTWAVNSRENKLTPWYNDTRTDNRGELLFLRTDAAVYDLCLGAQCVFRPENAQYLGRAGAIETEVRVSVPPRGMAKYIDVTLKNTAGEEIPLELVYYTEPVLGVNRSTARFIQSKQAEAGLTLSSPWNSAVPGTAAMTVSGGPDFFCCDRPQFWSGNWDGKRHLPLPDGCAAVGKRIKLPPGRQQSVRFVLAFAAREDAALRMATLTPRPGRANRLTISTPDEALNVMVNTWLPAQIFGSRINGRTGFYQCGGAWGFRDQLQDAGNVVLLDPALTKRQILRAASHQFPEGDVLHWWHRLPANGGGLRGVRTRYSDDLLWLPFVTAQYIGRTGDASILTLRAPYLEGEPLGAEEHERYFEPRLSRTRGTVYEHCVRATEHAMRCGPHGLPLIGGGDWNDGYNQVGIRGQGESVWLAQFLAMTLDRMTPLCEHMEEPERAQRYREEAQRLREAVDANAWDGAWYLRAFYDDGTPMGGAGAPECEIDSLPQSFAVLSDMPDQARREQALDAAVLRLSDRKHGLIRLFSPAFSGKGRIPGYVAAYPQGFRENGGQYTHAAVWLCLALLEQGRVEEGWQLLRMINPAVKSGDPEQARAYRVEPYALAGDVSAAPHAMGRGGWSLYTGAAGWYYHTAVESLLGIRMRDGELVLAPRLPADWDGYTARLERGNARISIAVSRSLPKGLSVDGAPARAIPLDGTHTAAFGV